MINISKHPILKECYELIQAIENCGASDELTYATTIGSELLENLNNIMVDHLRIKGALVQIASYATSDEGDEEATSAQFGLDVQEVVEMAHDNMITLARSVLNESQ